MSTQDDIRPIPHAVGPEKSVLSVLLNEPTRFDDAADLTVDHFHLPQHRILFKSMRERIQSGHSIELIGLVEFLREKGRLDRVGGASGVADVYSYNSACTGFADHIRTLTTMLARRMAIDAGNEIIRVGYESDQPDDLLEVTSSPITALHDAITGTRPTRSKSNVLKSCMERFQGLCVGKVDPVGIHVSLVEINRRFRGLHPAQTIVISGYPGGGKTTLATQLAADAAVEDHRALIVSLEMPAPAVMNRLLAYIARRPGAAITDPVRYARETLNASGPTKELIAAVGTAARKLNEAPIHIEDMAGANVHQIASVIRRNHRKNPLEVVVVDFVQRIRPIGAMGRESREQQLAHASNHLADLARELGFCLLLPSQLNKEGAAKHAEAINEDADLHLQIVQDRSGPTPTFDHIGIACVKDRHHGQDGHMLPIILDGPMMRFVAKPEPPHPPR